MTAKSCPLFSVGAAEWIDHIKSRIRLSSYAQYKVKLEKNILPYFADIRINKITVEKVKMFQEHLLSEGMSERYTANILSVLKMIMKYLSNKYDFVDPTAGLELPKEQNVSGVASVYDEYSFQKMYRVLFDRPDLTKAGILVTLYTGLRIGELCALKWSDIDLENGTITVSKTIQRVSMGDAGGLIMDAPKSRAGMRTVPVTPPLAEYLRPFVTDGEKYFLSGTSAPLEPRTMQYRLRSFLNREGLPNITFGKLRKLFIERCVSPDIAALSEILGNATVQNVLPYCAKPTMNTKIRIMESFNKASYIKQIK